MNIQVVGRKMSVTDSLREYAKEKISTAMKAFEMEDATAEVLLRVEKNRAIALSNIVEVTIRLKGHTLRVSESAEDMYAAIDLASEKVRRQIRKYKTKVVERKKRPVVLEISPEDYIKLVGTSEKEATEEAEDDESLMVRTKYVELGMPMSDEEALVEIDLVGHDFFLYISDETGIINVAYRRTDGGYGIIKPKIEEYTD